MNIGIQQSTKCHCLSFLLPFYCKLYTAIHAREYKRLCINWSATATLWPSQLLRIEVWGSVGWGVLPREMGLPGRDLSPVRTGQGHSSWGAGSAQAGNKPIGRMLVVTSW